MTKEELVQVTQTYGKAHIAHRMAEKLLADYDVSESNMRDIWISVKDQMPDPKSGLRVCVYTPSHHEHLRYRITSVTAFNTIRSEATHWYYMTPPSE